MEFYVKIPVVFWLESKDEYGNSFYYVYLDGYKEKVYSKRFSNILQDAKYLCYPVICLN